MNATAKTRLPLAPSEEPDFRARVAAKNERVHILTGTVCNNNCIFCMEEDRDGRKVTNARTDDALVAWILETHPGCEEVCFTSGEPTTNPSLARWASEARDAGVRRVSVMTNGRALSYARFARGLVKAGINRFYISIHGHEARLHDSLVRTPGAFEQTVGGLEQIAALRRYGVELHTSTVLTKRNLPYVGDIYRFLRGLGVQQVVLNVMQANGRANTHFERIFPSYTEIAAQVGAFLEEQTKIEDNPPAFLIDIPPCTTTALPDFNRGFVESYKHFEPPEGGHDVVLAAERDASFGPSGDLAEVRRTDLDGALREKRAECARCKYDAACEGVWSNYLARQGWDEMQPVID